MARNNARRILPRFLALGLLVLALAGCVRFQADLTLTPQDTVSGSIVVAVILTDDTDETREGTATAATQIATSLLGNLATTSGVTTTDYEQDGYLGQRLDFVNVPLNAFSGTDPGALHFERDGDEFVFSGAIDFTGESGEVEGTPGAEDDGNLTVKVTFPGTVTETDGTVQGTTVSWSTAVDQRLEMNARGAATAPGLPIGIIIGIAAAVLVVIAAVVGFLLLRARRKAAVAAGAAPATLDPAFASPAAVAPEVAGAPTPPAAIPPATTPAATAPPAATPPKAPKPPKAAATAPAATPPAASAPKAPRAPKTPKTPPTPDA
jgi:hypothetical protein